MKKHLPARLFLRVACLLLLAGPAALAQNKPTLKMLMVICDDYESPENNKIAQSVRFDLATMTRLLDILEKRNIVNVERTLLQGRKATLKNINATLNALNAGPNDVVWFYFSGHGGMENGKTFLSTSDEKDLPRSTLQNILNAKPARLKILMTDACSNDVNGGAVSRSLSRNASPAQEGRFDAVYRDLFSRYAGMLHMSGSTEGEYAWSDDDMGGHFTHYFIRENLIKNPINSWVKMFDDARQKTMRMFNLGLSASQRSELAREGIRSQTPRTYAVPQLKGTLASQTAPAAPAAQPIVVRNLTKQAISFFIDNNPTSGIWSEAKLDKRRLAPGGTTKLSQRAATVGFVEGNSESYYELETGNYSFEVSDNGEVDLYVEETDKTAPPRRSNTQRLTGKWLCTDQEGETAMTFQANGTFTEKEPEGKEVLETGAWQVVKLMIREREKTAVKITMEDEDGEIALYYLLTFDNDDNAELSLHKILIDGEKVPVTKELKLESVLTLERM